MAPTHTLDTLALAHVRSGQMQGQAMAERLRGASPRRQAFAEYLRRAADCLDRTPLARTPASQS